MKVVAGVLIGLAVACGAAARSAGPTAPGTYELSYYCARGGVTYAEGKQGGLAVLVDRDGKPVPCETYFPRE